MNRLPLFLVFFTVINLIFIPLLSLYGLRVCPVLSVPGFGFGCYYSALFILFANTLNLFVIFFLHRKNNRNQAVLWFKKNSFLAYASAYVISTLIALVFLQLLLKSNHLTTHSRAPEILGFASLLLGLTQAYGLNWAFATSTPSEPSTKDAPAFQKLWLAHTFRTLLPVMAVSAVILHFLFSQSTSFNEGKTAPVVSHDEIINSTALVILVLIGWLFITLTFHFLSERDHATNVQKHLQKLHDLDFKFRSEPSKSWGLWTAILNQLNTFSQTLGEKTRLLKSFSRFVTASVAEKAVHQDLSVNGVARELTVIISDIRNFTAISEKMPPEQVVTLLNEYFTAMLEVISAYPIQVDKFIGDGILAYVETDAEDTVLHENQMAVEAALTMIEKLNPLNTKFKAMGLPELKIGIGIFRGPVVIGLIGSDSKLQHTIIGDTVNRTARLESLCKELSVSIVISEYVFASLSDEQKQKFQSFGNRTAKGLSESIGVFGGPILNQIHRFE